MTKLPDKNQHLNAVNGIFAPKFNLGTTTTMAHCKTKTGNKMIKAGLLAAALQISTLGISVQATANTGNDRTQGVIQNNSGATFQTEVGLAKSSMMADPAAALTHAIKAQDLTVTLDSVTQRKESLATALWLQSEALLRTGRSTESCPLLERSLVLVADTGDGTKLVGDLHLALARALKKTGDVSGAMDNLQKAHEIFEQLGEKRSAAMVLLTIGSIYNEAQSYNNALEFFARAIVVYPSDPALELSAANNSGNAYKALGKHDRALAHFKRALEISAGMDSAILQGRILTNMASVQVLQNDLDAAEASTGQALALLGEAGDNDWSKFVWGIKADIALAQNKPFQAVEYIAQTFDGSNIAATSVPFLEMHQIAQRVYRLAGQDALSLDHLKSFERLDGMVREAGATISLALDGTKFNFARH